MTERRNASNNGSDETRQQEKCQHHWILSNTKYPIVKKDVGQVNLGRTEGRCKLCGETRRWESPTPDNIHGIESLIVSNIKIEDGTLPEGFELDDELA